MLPGGHRAQVTLTTTTLLDTTPPWTGPVVSVNEVGSNYAHLSWTPPQDDGPHFTYEIWANGGLRATTGRNITSTILRFLQPKQTYSITVRGRDYGNHWSPFSDPVSVTALPPNPNDHTPPTAPTNVAASVMAITSSRCRGPNRPMTSMCKRISATMCM